MIKLSFLFSLFLFLLLSVPSPASAAGGLEGGLTTHAVEVQADFSGAALTIFGTLPTDSTKRDKIFILVEGPKKDIALWEKKRVAGIWTNKNKKVFRQVSGFHYLVANNKIEARQRSMVLQNIANAADKAVIERLLQKKKLFSALDGEVSFLGRRLFKTRVQLPPSAPIGDYVVRIIHFNAGKIVQEVALPLTLNKIGWGQTLGWLAHEWAFFYGLLAVGLSLLLGWGITELLRRLT